MKSTLEMNAAEMLEYLRHEIEAIEGGMGKRLRFAAEMRGEPLVPASVYEDDEGTIWVDVCGEDD